MFHQMSGYRRKSFCSKLFETQREVSAVSQYTGIGRTERTGNRRHANDRMYRPIPGSWEDRSIDGFCIRHNMSRASYYNRRRRGLAPVEVQPVPGGKISITEAAEREYDARYSRPAVAQEA
jgi:hypothetical protein